MIAPTEKRLQQVALMNEITRAALQAKDLESMTAELASRMGELIGADSCFITLWDEERKLPIPAAAYGAFSEQYGNEPALPGEVTMTESVLKAGKPIALDDIQGSKYGSPRIAALMPIRSLLALPLVVGDQWLGAAMIAFENQHHFTTEEVEIGEQAANQIALAIAWAKLYEAERRRSAELESLRRASIGLTSSMEIQAVLDAILENALKLVDAYDAHIFLYDGESLTFAGARWAGSTKETPHSEPRQEGLTYRVARSGERFVIPDAASDAIYADSAWEGAIIGMPLCKGERVLGVMNVAYQRPHHFSEAEVRALELLADQAAIALENARLHTETERRLQDQIVLRKAIHAISSSLNSEEVLAALVEQLGLSVDATSAYICELDDETSLATVLVEYLGPAAKGRERQTDVGVSYPVREDSEFMRKMRQGRFDFSLVGDPALDEQEEAHMRKYGVKSILYVPLVAQQRLIGFAEIWESRAKREFSSEEIELCQNIASQAAITIENAQLFEQTIAEQQRLQLLYRIAQVIAVNLKPQEILERALDLSFEYLGGMYCDVFLLDQGSDRLALAASAGLDPGQIARKNAHIDLHLGEGLIGWSAAEAQTFLVPDVRQDARWLGMPGLDDEVRSAMGAPILIGESVKGVLGIFHAETEAFDQEHLELLTAISTQLGLALSNAERYQQAERQLAELRTIQQVAQVVNRRLEMQPLLAEVVHQVREVFGYAIVEIFLVEGDQLVQRSALEVLGKDTLSIALDQGVIGRVARTNQSAFVPVVGEDPDFLPGAPDSQCEIAVPLRKGDVVIGVLNVESTAPGDLSEADLRLLTLLADQVSIAIENAALYDRLRQHTTELESIVQERTDELAQALEVARQADRLKTQFVSDVSHELRTPLSNIRLYLELIETGNRERFDEYLETLNRETDRLVALIEDLLTVSRLDAGTANPEPERMDINALAQILVQDRQRLCAEKDLVLEFTAGEDLPSVMGDAHMLSQAIANLMTNAMNYTAAGGTIRITTELRIDDGKQWVVLSVHDTGMGISAKEQNKVFERFFRGAASRQFGTPGTGLGLSIAKEIMERHGGDIHFESQPGQGSAFSVHLPVERS
jgi:GAF domain-containing protein